MKLFKLSKLNAVIAVIFSSVFVILNFGSLFGLDILALDRGIFASLFNDIYFPAYIFIYFFNIPYLGIWNLLPFGLLLSYVYACILSKFLTLLMAWIVRPLKDL